MKKTQATIFLILGVVIVFGILATLMLTKKTNLVNRENIGTTSFSQDINFFNALREKCIQDSVKNAIIYRGLENGEETDLESYIKYYLYYCLMKNGLPQKGYTFSIDTPLSPDYTVDVQILDDTINVYGNLPVEISRDNEKQTYKEFSYSLDRTTYQRIDGQNTRREHNLISNDGDVSITIPEDTQVKDKSGNDLNEINIKILDKNEVSNNKYIEGKKVYFVTDSQFSNNVKVCMDYSEDILKPTTDEKELSLAWYDENRKVWVIRPSKIDLNAKRVCADFEHFSDVAMVTQDTETTGDPKSWFWNFFIEHVHRPCDPTPINDKEMVREIDHRYVGLYNQLPEKKEYDSHEQTRWKLNFYPESEDGLNAPHRGSVYATPQMQATLLLRGHDNSETEYQHKSGIIALKEELFLNNIWKFDNLKQTFYENLNKGLYNNVESQELLNDMFNSQSIEIDETKFDRTTGKKKLLYLNEHGNIKEWSIVNSEPNEHAEDRNTNIQDWDDDDQESLLDKKCDGKSCLMCNYFDPIDKKEKTTYCEDIYNVEVIKNKLSNNIDFEKECFELCIRNAEQLYKTNFESNGFTSWNPSNDGILDFKWVNNKLERTKLTCYLDTFSYDISDCDVKDTDIATPMFWGYGIYREGKELGYEGAGNNYKPYSPPNFKIEPPICDNAEATLRILCSPNDECHVILNGVDYSCTETECNKEVINTLKSENRITGYVINKRRSEDVCAAVSAELVLTECPSTEKNRCGDNIVQQPNDDGFYEICDGSATGTPCDGKCLDNCMCPPPQQPSCGDSVCNDGNEKTCEPNGASIDMKCSDNKYTGTSITEGLCRASGTNVCTYCGDGIKQSPDEECESNADCVSGKKCDTANCKCVGENEPICGDGQCNDGPSKTCEPNGNKKCPSEEILQNVLCRASGTYACTYCGDGKKEEIEACDDGNNVNGDGCDANCKKEPFCGNNIKEGNEECDGTDDEKCPGKCKSDCTCPKEPPEELSCCECHYSQGTGCLVWSKCKKKCPTPGHISFCDVGGKHCGDSCYVYGVTETACVGYTEECNKNAKNDCTHKCNNNGVCEENLGEKKGTCSDCNDQTTISCDKDKTCESGETCSNCPEDCGACGTTPTCKQNEEPCGDTCCKNNQECINNVCQDKQNNPPEEPPINPPEEPPTNPCTGQNQVQCGQTTKCCEPPYTTTKITATDCQCCKNNGKDCK